ncbi:MAG: hypothetical protein ACOZAN_04895 [Patescibacteria group bacterium]
MQTRIAEQGGIELHKQLELSQIVDIRSMSFQEIRNLSDFCKLKFDQETNLDSLVRALEKVLLDSLQCRVKSGNKDAVSFVIKPGGKSFFDFIAYTQSTIETSKIQDFLTKAQEYGYEGTTEEKKLKDKVIANYIILKKDDQFCRLIIPANGAYIRTEAGELTYDESGWGVYKACSDTFGFPIPENIAGSVWQQVTESDQRAVADGFVESGQIDRLEELLNYETRKSCDLIRTFPAEEQMRLLDLMQVSAKNLIGVCVRRIDGFSNSQTNFEEKKAFITELITKAVDLFADIADKLIVSRATVDDNLGKYTWGQLKAFAGEGASNLYAAIINPDLGEEYGGTVFFHFDPKLSARLEHYPKDVDSPDTYQGIRPTQDKMFIDDAKFFWCLKTAGGSQSHMESRTPNSEGGFYPDTFTLTPDDLMEIAITKPEQETQIREYLPYVKIAQAKIS